LQNEGIVFRQGERVGGEFVASEPAGCYVPPPERLEFAESRRGLCTTQMGYRREMAGDTMPDMQRPLANV